MRKHTSSKLALVGLVFLILILAQPGNISFQMETFQENGNFPINNFTEATLPDTIDAYDIYYAPIADDFYTDIDFPVTYDMDRTMIWWSASENTTFLGTDDIDEIGVSLEIIDSDTVRLWKDDHAMIYNGWSGAVIWYKVYVLEWSVASGVQVEHIFGEDSFGVYPIGDTVDLNHAFVFNWGSTGQYTDMHSGGVAGARLLNSTHYELINPALTSDYFTDEFVQIVHGELFTVYNGSEDTIDIEYNVTDSIGATIDPSKSIAFGFMDTDQNTNAYPQRYGAGIFLNTTHITFMSDQDVTWGISGNTFYWTVVESVLFEVQDVIIPYGSGARIANATINAVETDRTIILTAGCFVGYYSWFGGLIAHSATNNEYNVYTPLAYYFEDTTTVSFVCSSGSNSFSSKFFAIEIQALPNQAPVNDQAPTSSNLDDTDNLYAQYREYQITAYVSDADGYADIDYLEIGIWDNTQTTEYYRIRYDEDTNTFSEEYDAGTMATLNTGSSSATESGNDIDATFYVTIDWDFTDLIDLDLKCYVIDASSGSDTDWYEVNWDIETRLTFDTETEVWANEGICYETGVGSGETPFVASYVRYDDSTYWTCFDVDEPFEIIMDNNISLGSGYKINSIYLDSLVAIGGTGTMGAFHHLYIWDWTDEEWDQVANIDQGSFQHDTFSSSDSRYWNDGLVKTRHNASMQDGSTNLQISIDELSVIFNYESQHLDDGSGTVYRGNYNQEDTITATGTISYYGSGYDDYPASDKVDVWITCSDVTGSPWSDLTLSSGYFETTVDSDDLIGLDTYTFKVVEESAGSGGSSLLDDTYSRTYIADRLIFTATSSANWQIIAYSITVSTSAIWDYDDVSFTGSYSWSYEVGSTTQTTGGNYSYHVVSFTDPLHGVTAFVNNTDFCFFDTIVVSPPYYWVQYSPEMVWLIWGSPSTYTWLSNSSGVGSGVVIQSYVNGSVNALGYTYGSGSLSGLAIGSLDPSWYWATITINAEIGSYDWAIWNKTLEVSILHSLHIENFEIEPTDYWFWIAFTSNLGNASITIWDDAIDSGLLFTDAIYYSTSEGFHSIARSTVIGTHNVTICITSTGNQYGRYYNVSDWVWWYNWSYIVQTDFTLVDWVPSIEETTVAVSGTISKSATWQVFYDGSESASYTGSISAGYFDRISWTKHETPGFHSWKLTFTNGTDTISIGGVFYTYQTNIDDKPDGNTPDPDLDWRFRQTTWQNIMLVIVILAIVGSWFFPKNINRSLNLPNMKE